MDDARMKAFVGAQDWTFAKTYADTAPHEYLVKTRLVSRLISEFESIVRYIRRAGFQAYYFETPGKYYVLGEHYYWTMGNPVEETTILNRAKLSDYELINNQWRWKGPGPP